MKPAEKYTILWSIKGLNALDADLVTSSAYVEPGCIVFIENGVWRLCYAPSFIERLSEEGYKYCFTPGYLQDYKKKILDKSEDLGSFISRSHQVLDADHDKYIKLFDEFVRISIEFASLYHRTEFFYFIKLEEELTKWAKTVSPDKYAGVISDLLAGKEMPDLPENISRIVEFIREMQELKWRMRDVFNRALLFRDDSLLSVFARKFAELTGRKDFYNLRADEIRDVIAGKEVPDSSEREKLLIVHFADGQWRFETGDSARTIAEKLPKPEKTKDISELRGTIACVGKAKGTARVYPWNARSFENFSKGDVLITLTTDPEFMVAMQKAAAIVTEEGGLMSHAALVSRELKIPCLIGTKNATKVFKDGDKVEVDADKGTIKKIS